MRWLRFLAFLEPGQPPKVSWAQVGFATMGFATLVSIVYIAFYHPGNYAAVLSALAGFVPFVVNMIHARMHGGKEDDDQ